MGEVKIVDIKPVPWWKFWKVDVIEATLEDEYGNRKTVSVYDSLPILKGALKNYVAEKYCTGDQWWSFKQRQKRLKKREKVKRPSKEEQILMAAADLVGETFDCVLVLSKEGSE